MGVSVILNSNLRKKDEIFREENSCLSLIVISFRFQEFLVINKRIIQTQTSRENFKHSEKTFYETRQWHGDV